VVGQVVKTNTIPANKETSLKLDAPGLYLLNITTPNQTWVKKLVVGSK
jgi:hypothetical protein